MKTKHLFLVIVLLLTGSGLNAIQAQDNVKAVMKKCESMDGVSMSRVRNRDGGKERQIVSLNFKNNPQLVNEFIEALKRDEDQATQIIESKENGKLTPTYYRFAKVAFSFNIDKAGTGAQASWIED